MVQCLPRGGSSQTIFLFIVGLRSWKGFSLSPYLLTITLSYYLLTIVLLWVQSSTVVSFFFSKILIWSVSKEFMKPHTIDSHHHITHHIFISVIHRIFISVPRQDLETPRYLCCLFLLAPILNNTRITYNHLHLLHEKFFIKEVMSIYNGKLSVSFTPNLSTIERHSVIDIFTTLVLSLGLEWGLGYKWNEVLIRLCHYFSVNTF